MENGYFLHVSTRRVSPGRFEFVRFVLDDEDTYCEDVLLLNCPETYGQEKISGPPTSIFSAAAAAADNGTLDVVHFLFFTETGRLIMKKMS